MRMNLESTEKRAKVKREMLTYDLAPLESVQLLC